MSAEEYCLSASRKVAGLTFLNFGFTGNVTEPVLDIMGEVIGRYLHKLGSSVNQFKEHAGRTEVNLADVQLTFDQFKISTSDLEEYFRQMEPTPFPDPVSFPIPKKNSLNFLDPNYPEAIERLEHIFDFLPSMLPKQDSPEKMSPLASQNSMNGMVGNSTNECSTPGGNKSTEYLTPVALKRARMSELPEEAGHSHYEMKCIALTSSGFLNLRKGLRPDSRMPPPPIRYIQPSFMDTTCSTAHDQLQSPGGNKENADESVTEQQPPVRISLSSKDGATIISTAPTSTAALGKMDGKKSLKKREKTGSILKGKKDRPRSTLKTKKPKLLQGVEMAEPKIKVVVGDSQTTVEPLKITPAPPKDKIKNKMKDKIKDKYKNKDKSKEKSKDKSKEKSAPGLLKLFKTVKLKEKKERKKPKLAPSVSNASLSIQQSSSTDVVTTPQEMPLKSVTPAPPVIHRPSAPETGLRQVFCPTDIFGTPSQQTSAQQLLDIDDSINAVVRDSAAIADQHDKQGLQPALLPSTPTVLQTPTPTKKRGRPKKVKQTKSSEFVADEVLLREAQDDLSPKITSQPPFSMATGVSGESIKPNVVTEPCGTVLPKKKVKKEKEGKQKKKKEKDGLVKVKKPKKKKLLPQVPPVVETKPEPDRFSQQQPEMKVFDFGQAESPPSSLARRPSQAEVELAPPSVPSTLTPVHPPSTPTHSHMSSTPVRPPSTPTPSHVSSTPTPTRGSMSPLESRSLVIKSPTPETVMAASSASTSSAASAEQPPLLPLKIGIASTEDKDQKRRERSKDREHRKEKKVKKRKREKDHSKEHHKDRHERHKHKKARKERGEKKEELTMAEGLGFKLRIKLGSNPQDSTVTATPETRAVPELKRAPGPELAVEPKPVPEVSSHVVKEIEDVASTLSPSQGGLKLVIRNPEIAASQKSQKKPKEGKAAEKSVKPRKKRSDSSGKKHPESVHKKHVESGSSHKKHKLSKSSIKEPRNTPPTLLPASPLPGTPPPPVLSRNNSPVKERSPSPKRPPADTTRGRSPVSKVSPTTDKFLFTSPSSSPPRGSRPPSSPPPRTPSPSHRKSPSPMPKTPSPRRQRRPSSPLNLSSYISPPHRSPLSASHKSPTPTPKTPSLSPAYQPPFPLTLDETADAGTARQALNETVGSPPPSPYLPGISAESEKPEPAQDTSLTPVTPKPKGKVGRPRSKSPRTDSPKGKVPKSAKSPKVPKEPKPAVPGKAGRGRPPKAKTLALRAAQAAAAIAAQVVEEESPKFKPPALSPIQADDEDNRMPPPLPLASVEVGRGADSSSSGSPDHLAISLDEEPTTAYSGDSQVETETVGSFIDCVTGQKVWICPGCKCPDDGTAMIGCDECDDWYHWPCVNLLKAPPQSKSWYCPRCKAKAKKTKIPLEQSKPKGKRGRKKKVQSPE